MLVFEYASRTAQAQTHSLAVCSSDCWFQKRNSTIIQNHTSITKKPKTLRFLDNEEAGEENMKEGISKGLTCVLPSGKKYSLKIVSGKIKNRKIEKL
jgi:hypothetical protein